MLTRKDLAAAMIGDSGRVSSINEGTMAVSCIISTQAEDRSGDVVRSLGIDTKNHIKNPVVLWDHGMSGLVTPIGKAEDPTGRYTVRIEDDRVTATTYFSQKLPEAAQFFALIAEGTLRGASIGFKARRMVPRGKGYLVDECELLEYSHTTIPDNQDALCRILDLKRVGSTPLCPVVMKSLRTAIAGDEVRRAARGLADGMIKAFLAGIQPRLDEALRNAKAVERMRLELKGRLDYVRAKSLAKPAHYRHDPELPLAERVKRIRSAASR